jgi:hypothetical protein
MLIFSQQYANILVVGLPIVVCLGVCRVEAMRYRVNDEWFAIRRIKDSLELADELHNESPRNGIESCLFSFLNNVFSPATGATPPQPAQMKRLERVMDNLLLPWVNGKNGPANAGFFEGETL